MKNKPTILLMVVLAAYLCLSRCGDGGSGSMSWKQVNIDGFGDANTTEITAIIDFNDALYVGTWNDIKGAGIWKHDRVNWEQVNTDGFGNPNNIAALSMSIYNNELYVGTYNRTTGAEMWKFDGVNWSDISPPNEGTNGVWAMHVFRNQIYAGLGNINNGAEIWKYDGVNWEQVATGGFGDKENREYAAMSVYNDALYVGTWNPVTGAEIWEYDGVGWTQINTDGFGGEIFKQEATNQGAWSMQVYADKLYVGIGNIVTGAEIWKYDGIEWAQINEGGFGDNTNSGPWSMTTFRDEKFNQKLYVGLLNKFKGAGTWSYDGSQWEQESELGFGDVNNATVRWMHVFKGALYAGTWNRTTGAELWRFGY